jgi:transposase, IS30 family
VSARAIAQELGRHHATISREIRRNTEQRPYEAEGSQQAYEHRRNSVSKGKWTEEWAAQIEEKLH